MIKKILISLSAICLVSSPSLAVNSATGTGLTPLIVFRSHAPRTLEIDYAPAATFTSTSDDVYDYVQSGSNNVADYLNSGSGYSFSPPPLPPVVPTINVAGFQLAVAQDAAIPVPALLQFCGYAGVVNATTMQTLPVTQALWAKAKAADAATNGPFSGNCVDDPATKTIDESTIPITTRLETTSAAYLCPLNPAITQ